jgi:hypothetical protein
MLLTRPLNTVRPEPVEGHPAKGFDKLSPNGVPAINKAGLIISQALSFPLFRPEHHSFWRTRPAGERQGRRSFSQGQGRPFENPRQKREAQDQGGIRVAFLLVTFLWPNKEKLLGCRSEHRHINSRRDSDTNPKPTRNIE